MPKFDNFQQAVIDEVRTGSQALVVIARAGSGKTTTAVAASNEIKPGYRACFVSFSKAVQEELSGRLPNFIDSRTVSSLGFEAIRSNRPGVNVDRWKMRKIVYPLVTGELKKRRLGFKEDATSYVQYVLALVGLMKNTLPSNKADVERLVHQNQIYHPSLSTGDLVDWAVEALNRSNNDTKNIDFDDMVYLPAKYGYYVPQYDIVFVDEAQDLSLAQVDIVLKMTANGGRLIAIGDPRQAIYHWRGAASNIMDTLCKKFNAKQMPLSVTYRCPTSVVDHVRELVPDLQARPNAPIGSVEQMTFKDMYGSMNMAYGNDFVLSRINAPLAGMCAKWWSMGMPAYVKGKFFGDAIMQLVVASNADSLRDLLTWLDDYDQRRLKDVTPDTDPDSVALMLDQSNAIRSVAKNCNDIQELRDLVRRMFSDTPASNAIMCSSVHKAKGLETDRVWLLTNTFGSGDPRQSNDEATENLYYVAATRAKESLFLLP